MAQRVERRRAALVVVRSVRRLRLVADRKGGLEVVRLGEWRWSGPAVLVVRLSDVLHRRLVSQRGLLLSMVIRLSLRLARPSVGGDRLVGVLVLERQPMPILRRRVRGRSGLKVALRRAWLRLREAEHRVCLRHLKERRGRLFRVGAGRLDDPSLDVGNVGRGRVAVEVLVSWKKTTKQAVSVRTGADAKVGDSLQMASTFPGRGSWSGNASAQVNRFRLSRTKGDEMDQRGVRREWDGSKR